MLVARACMVAFGLAIVSLGLVARNDRPAGASAALPRQQQINLAVVAIDARIGGDVVHSSGTVIDANRGLVLTSNRAVWGATSLRIGTALGLVYGRVVARAPCDDLALLEMLPQLPGLVALPRAAGRPGPGQLVTSVGRRRVDPDLAANSLLQIPALRAAARGTSRITLDGRLVPEALGGPLIDTEGRLVGIAQAGLGDLPRAESGAVFGLDREPAAPAASRPASGLRRLALAVRMRGAAQRGHAGRAPGVRDPRRLAQRARARHETARD